MFNSSWCLAKEDEGWLYLNSLWDFIYTAKNWKVPQITVKSIHDRFLLPSWILAIESNFKLSIDCFSLRSKNLSSGWVKCTAKQETWEWSGLDVTTGTSHWWFPSFRLLFRTERCLVYFPTVKNWNSLTMYNIAFQVEESLIQLFSYVGKGQLKIDC